MSGAMRVRVNGKEVPVDHERFMLLKLIDERGSISSASLILASPTEAPLPIYEGLRKFSAPE